MSLDPRVARDFPAGRAKLQVIFETIKAKKTFQATDRHLTNFGESGEVLNEGDEQMLGLDLRVAHLLGELLRSGHRLLRFFGVFIDIHRRSSRSTKDTKKRDFFFVIS